MRNIMIITAMLFASVAHADVLDDNLAKAQKSVENAEKRLAKAEACIANRPVCLVEMTEKAQKSADRAAKKLAALLEAADTK